MSGYLFIGSPIDGRRIWIEDDLLYYAIGEYPKIPVRADLNVSVNDAAVIHRHTYTKRALSTGKKHVYVFAHIDIPDDQIIERLINRYPQEKDT